MTLTKIPFISARALSCLHAFVFLASIGSLWGQHPFSKKQVLEDLDFLRASLEETHYDLYAYTPKGEFDRNFEEVKALVRNDSLSLLEATGLFQRVISKAENGHTEIVFPGQSYIEYIKGGGPVFPLEIAFEEHRSLVRKNWSDNDSIGIGSEVLSINGIAMAEILSTIYPLVSAERPYFKNAKIEVYSFPRYYWQVFGEQDAFEVEIRSEDGVMKHAIRAVPAIEGYEMKRQEVLNAAMDLQFFEAAAYLNPGGFGGDEEIYRHFIDSAFAEIKASPHKNLIIDLRNNPGGDDSFSDYLVSYFADKPFYWNSSFSLKTSERLKEQARQHNDTTSRYWQNVLSHKNGEVFPYSFEAYPPQPGEKRFAGNVYVLINRQSHSQAAVTAAQIQDYAFGTLVGEETGDYPTLYASVFRYELPNTGVPVQVAKGHIVRVNGSTAAQGVIPDIRIQDHLRDEQDEILEGLLAILHGDRTVRPDVTIAFHKNIELVGYLINLVDPADNLADHPISRELNMWPGDKELPVLAEILEIGGDMGYNFLIDLFDALPVFPLDDPYELPVKLLHTYGYDSDAEISLVKNLIHKANEFSKTSHFESVWKKLEPYRQQTVGTLYGNLSSKQLIPELEKFYGYAFSGYEIVPSQTLWSGPGWGRNDRDRDTAVFVLGPLGKNYDYADQERFQNLAIHEFGHAFVNEVVLENRDLIRKTEALFEPIKESMVPQGYSDWQTCLIEHFVRAGEVLLSESLGDSSGSRRLLEQYAEQRKFTYLPFIVERLNDYRTSGKFSYSQSVYRTLGDLEKEY